MDDKLIYHAYTFPLRPTKEQIVVLEKWIGDARAILNFVSASLFYSIERINCKTCKDKVGDKKQHYIIPVCPDCGSEIVFSMNRETNGFETYPRFITKEYSTEQEDIKKRIASLKAGYMQATLKKYQSSSRPFRFKTHEVWGRKQEGMIVTEQTEDGVQVFLLIPHPYDRGEMKIKVDVRDSWKRDRMNLILSLSNINLPFSIRRNVKREYMLTVNPTEMCQEKEVPMTIMGVDLGIGRNVAVSVILGTDGKFIKSRFWSARELQHIRRTLPNRRRELKKKIREAQTTPQRNSLKKKLQSLSTKSIENNIISEICNELVIMAKEYNSYIIVESVEDYRVAARGKGVGVEGPRVKGINRALNRWQYGKFIQLIESRCDRKGLMYMTDMNPENNSRKCPKCGYINEGERDFSSHIYKCESCGYTNNVDWVGAYNTAFRGISLLPELNIVNEVTGEHHELPV